MKLGICCNFVHPSAGGSEIVCKAIAEQMANEYGISVTTFGYNIEKDFIYNGVDYKKCLKGEAFLRQIRELDHLLVYSDSFWGFEDIVRNIDNIASKVSIVLVGAYHMSSSPEVSKLLKDNIDRFNLITHSSVTADHKWCLNNNLDVKVIPNGVYLSEFRENSINLNGCDLSDRSLMPASLRSQS